MSRCSFSYLVSLLSFISLLSSQTLETPPTAKPTFKSKVPLVLIDVAVSDRNGQPIVSLRKEDFEISENGERQAIGSFEEHRSDILTVPRKSTPLPPHFFTNAPTSEPPASVNVLLLDALNTPFGDQASVRGQMIEYLKKVDPGPRLAIFTLGSRLRMVEGFTAEPKALIEALNHKKWGGVPTTSPILRTQAEDNLDQRIVARMADRIGMNSGASSAAIEALARFQAEIAATEAVSRMATTLDALQELSRYLSGYRGRKNVIWFSGSFPRITFPSGGEGTRTDTTEENGLAPEMKKTINMLAGAQIAVYPISAQGLDTESMYQAQVVGHPMGFGTTAAEQVINGHNASLNNENVNRYFTNKAADDIASNTGGQAFYNNNGLKEALADAVHKGGFYYRISYSPTDKRMLGRYRHIKVKIKTGPHPTPNTIAYRHGYYEENEKQLLKTANAEVPTDMLRPLMGKGLPDATEIIYKLRLVRSNWQPTFATLRAGDNPNLKQATNRFIADFVIPVESLSFQTDSDGVLHGNVELGLVAYDHGGTPLNWITRSFRTTLKPEIYPQVQKSGVQFHEEIDLPDGDLYLRSGVYDLQSNQAGTFEVLVGEITAPEVVSAETPSAIGNPIPSESPSDTASPATQVSRSLVPDLQKVDALIAKAGALAAIQQPPRPALSELSAQDIRVPEPAEIPAYCASLSENVEHNAALARACEFVLSIPKRLPNIICDREVKRYWTEYHKNWGGWKAGAVYGEKHADVLTAQVSYRDGKEYFENVRLDGQLLTRESSLLPASSLPGTSSVGEFANILAGTFLPSAKAEFRFQGTTKIGSAKALLFAFHVDAKNNHAYFLFAGDKIWFPEFSGQLWIDERTLQLLSLRRETAYMSGYPIRQVKTSIDYANVSLGDGTSFVLPVHSDVRTCSPPARGNSDNCSRDIVRFTNWHKFRATTNIVANPQR